MIIATHMILMESRMPSILAIKLDGRKAAVNRIIKYTYVIGKLAKTKMSMVFDNGQQCSVKNDEVSSVIGANYFHIY